MKEDIEDIKDEYALSYQDFAEKEEQMEHIQDLLISLKKMGEDIQNKEDFSDFCKKAEDIYPLVDQLVDECIEEQVDSVSEMVEEEKEKMDSKQKTMDSLFQDYDLLFSDSKKTESIISYHLKTIEDYLKKIDQIRAYEVVVYRSNIMNKSLKFTEKLIKRAIESKMIGTILPKQVADFYLALTLMKDAKKVIHEDIVITKKEVDTSYYADLIEEQKGVQKHQEVLADTLKEIQGIQKDYQKICKNFPNDILYLENMKKLESLENTLIQQSLKLDQLEDDYEDTISYNENKIKILKE